MTNREYLVLLYSFVPFGPARCKLLISYFGNPKHVWQVDTQSLIEVGLKKETVTKFNEYRQNLDAEKYFWRLNKFAIKYLTYLDKTYPKNLKELGNGPCVLYLKGKLKGSDENAVAIVGARKMTAYGREVADNFAGHLAGMGVTIISGLARGIDSIAHQAALEAGGRTIAVLGCGLDIIYPPENIRLAKKIIESGGAILSEYPIGYPSFKNNFAARNRIISGLSKAVLVVEGEEKSGTLLTASHAADQGRTVFAVPGQITSPTSAAPLYLIKNGAKMVTEVRDILEELDVQLKVDKEVVEKILPTSKQEEDILVILEREPIHLDEIVRISRLQVADISARLTIMEMKGLVKNIGNGIYKKCQ